MSVQTRFSLLRSPAGIVIGYPVALVAVAVGLLTFPYSGILGLVSVLVGAVFIAAIPVLVTVYLLLTIAMSHALVAFVRRLRFGSDQNSRWKGKRLDAHRPGLDVWDRWVDGATRR
jgi:hypothetical protein